MECSNQRDWIAGCVVIFTYRESLIAELTTARARTACPLLVFNDEMYVRISVAPALGLIIYRYTRGGILVNPMSENYSLYNPNRYAVNIKIIYFYSQERKYSMHRCVLYSHVHKIIY